MNRNRRIENGEGARPSSALLSKRNKLPQRCPSSNIKVKTQENRTIHLTLQFNPEQPLAPEGVFYASGFRSGSQLEFQMHDACILISMLLQHGYTPEEILQRTSRLDLPNGEQGSGSHIGLVLSALITTEEGQLR